MILLCSELSSAQWEGSVGTSCPVSTPLYIQLLDEPFESVDMRTRRQLQRELPEIWRDTNKTVLFATHDIEESVTLSNRVVVMSGTSGRVRVTVSVAGSRPRNRSAQWFVGQVETLFERINSNT
ncbi:hypothetical protein GCM10009067_39880 [Haloarcula sebkhae]|uniref:ABC transporter domain-containing protein n=1 Tax=Haloarcula sebkhae TaxID=932660 RepID=A0A830F4J6_9EURY|nr:hypothetical protein GCM10009067_39880 [Haloarcula sebkhae]